MLRTDVVLFSALATLAGLLPQSASAIPIAAGTTFLASFRACVPGGSGCDDLVPRPTLSQYEGSPGAPSTTGHVELPGYGVAMGSAELNPNDGTPIVKAYTSSEPGARVIVNVAAVQRYTYTGATPTVRSFGGTLTYSQQPSTGTVEDGGGINALIQVFKLAGTSIEAGSTASSNFVAVFGRVDEPGYQHVGSHQHIDKGSIVDNGHVSLHVDGVVLNPGDSVWVRALMQTPSNNGGWIDAYHTLTTQWDDASHLVPASPVPELGSAVSMAAGLLALAGLARRRRQAAQAHTG